ncbi:uncharacterized protein [Antedon mediterranea]|uniref:uncharacterized protein isoform X2 n=1 Tax=Antedon mediterranea TaxID=105859 RepID=UPI003AF62726
MALNEYNEKKTCIYEKNKSGKRVVCANIFGGGNYKPIDTGVNLQRVTQYLTTQEEVWLNVSFQFPTDVEKYEYRGVLIQLTSADSGVDCLYLNFTQPLKFRDVSVSNKFTAVGMSFHFGCVGPVLPGKEYVVAVFMLSRDFISTLAEKDVIIPEDVVASLSPRTTRSSSSSSLAIDKWKPSIQELTFFFTNATIRFNLGQYTYSSYFVILRGVKKECQDGRELCPTGYELSVEFSVAQNNSINVSRYRSAYKGQSDNIPSTEGSVFLQRGSGAYQDVVFAIVEFYFVKSGSYKFILTPFSPECHPHTNECTKSITATQYNTGDPCFYQPCVNANCTKINHLDYQCHCNHAGFEYNSTVNVCIDRCESVQCRNSQCELSTKYEPVCKCWPGYTRDVTTNECIYTCNIGWCTKKTVAVLASLTALLFILPILFYIRRRKKQIEEKKFYKHSNDKEIEEEKDDVENLERLQSLKEFADSCDRKQSQMSSSVPSSGGQVTGSSSSSGYMLVSMSSDTSSASVSHCHCVPSFNTTSRPNYLPVTDTEH